ncbi:MAG: surface-adhesin E family protein [Caulobacteraceae bacterium]
MAKRSWFQPLGLTLVTTLSIATPTSAQIVQITPPGWTGAPVNLDPGKWIWAGSTPVEEGWTCVDCYSSSKVVLFYHRPIEHTASGLLRVWLREEWPQSRSGVLSDLVLEDADCEQSRVRVIQQTSFTRNNLSGDSINVVPNEGWLYAGPDTLGEALLNALCAPSPVWTAIDHDLWAALLEDPFRRSRPDASAKPDTGSPSPEQVREAQAHNSLVEEAVSGLTEKPIGSLTKNDFVDAVNKLIAEGAYRTPESRHFAMAAVAKLSNDETNLREALGSLMLKEAEINEKLAFVLGHPLTKPFGQH